LILLLAKWQVSDYRGAATVPQVLPNAKALIADKSHDSDWFRKALSDLDITPHIPGRKNHEMPRVASGSVQNDTLRIFPYSRHSLRSPRMSGMKTKRHFAAVAPMTAVRKSP
jgi:hypothetical protein